MGNVLGYSEPDEEPEYVIIYDPVIERTELSLALANSNVDPTWVPVIYQSLCELHDFEDHDMDDQTLTIYLLVGLYLSPVWFRVDLCGTLEATQPTAQIISFHIRGCLRTFKILDIPPIMGHQQFHLVEIVSRPL